jgi:hypothetical protein
VLLATTLALLALASNAAATPRSFYGIVPQGPLGAEDYARMGKGNVGTLRVPLLWGEVDQSSLPFDYDWSAFDEVVASAARNRIQVLPTVFGTPHHVAELDGCASACSIAAPRSQRALAAWHDFLRAAVLRYGPNGTLWTSDPTLPTRPIRVWQIWNEQNSPTYYGPKPDVGDYANLVAEAASAIRGADPGAEIVLGGMFGTPLGGADPAITAWDYIRQLYSHAGAREGFDGVALHPYAASLKKVRSQLALVLDEVRAAGDRNASLWITEIGWASGGEPHPFNKGKRGQAKRLRQAFRFFTRKRRELDLRNVDWFSWRDAGPRPGICKWCPRSGLFRQHSLTPKPAWTAFTRFTGGS